MVRPVLIVIGTRPEGIKMLSVYFAFKDAGIETLLCSTSQHGHLLDEVFEIFGVKPDIELDIMKPGQDLYYITSQVLMKMKDVYDKTNPAMVLVQGDTTTVMASALAAFYSKIPVGHVEAGLRTNDKMRPFPEEVNRKIVSNIADFNFAPTEFSVENLLRENVASQTVFCTGNTVVDALLMIKKKIDCFDIEIEPKIKNFVSKQIEENKKIVLVTAHRRESFGEPIINILGALKEFAIANPDVSFIYPYHPNPNVIKAINLVDLKSVKNIFLTEPVSYKELVYILINSDLVATDSGGIQEEGISLGKKVLVLRDKTERPEGIDAGFAFLVGSDKNKIKKMMEMCLKKSYNPQNKFLSVYGDGKAAEKIVSICCKKMLDQKKIKS